MSTKTEVHSERSPASAPVTRVEAPEADRPSPWSNPATNRRVLELLMQLDWSRARVLDVGAGSGWLSQSLSDQVAGRGLDPCECVFACDLMPESFLCRSITCSRMRDDGRLPYPDDHF